MEKVTLFAVLYDGNIVELKASIGDAIRFIYEEEFEQEFASNIADNSQPAASEVSEFIASFVSNLDEGDNDSLVFKWWKITPIPLSAEADYYAHCDDIWQVGGSI